jgi:hypothetical protein
MKNGISLLSLFCLSVMALAGSRTVQVDREVFSGKLNKAYWDKDYLIAIVLDASANAAQARVVARDGRRFDLHASVAGAQHVRIRHVAATPQGGLVATVEAIGPTGEVAGALYFHDPDGKIKEIVRTNPFLANMLVVDLSGDVWGLGSEIDHGTGYGAASVLWRFASDGRFKAKYLLRSSFGDKLSSHPAFLSARGGTPQLVACSDRIGIYSPGSAEWIEVGLNGSILFRAKVSGPIQGKMYRIAMTEGNRVFASFGGIAGIYELNRASTTWTLAGPDRLGERASAMYGGGGRELAVVDHDTPNVRLITLP